MAQQNRSNSTGAGSRPGSRAPENRRPLSNASTASTAVASMSGMSLAQTSSSGATLVNAQDPAEQQAEALRRAEQHREFLALAADMGRIQARHFMPPDEAERSLRDSVRRYSADRQTAFVEAGMEGYRAARRAADESASTAGSERVRRRDRLASFWRSLGSRGGRSASRGRGGA